MERISDDTKIVSDIRRMMLANYASDEVQSELSKFPKVVKVVKPIDSSSKYASVLNVPNSDKVFEMPYPAHTKDSIGHFRNILMGDDLGKLHNICKQENKISVC